MKRKLGFISANSAPSRAPSFWSNLVETWRKVRGLSAYVVGVTLGAAILYWIGTTHGWGLHTTFGSTNAEGAPSVGFVDCLYFSVITITTLGYGDFRPESYGRIVAGIEALAGIVLLGVFVSRLVSGQLDRRSKRLARGQLNTEIQEFREMLSSILKESFTTPAVSTQRSNWLYRARGLVGAIARYWRHESQDPELSETMPLRAANRLLGDLIDFLIRVETEVQGKKKKDLHREDHIAIRKISEGTLVLATVLLERSADDGLSHAYDRVCDIVGRLRAQLALHET